MWEVFLEGVCGMYFWWVYVGGFLYVLLACISENVCGGNSGSWMLEVFLEEICGKYFRVISETSM